MSASSTSTQLHAAILQYVTQLQAGGVSEEAGLKDAEPLEIALQCLIEATGADASNAPKDVSLLEIFTRGLASVSAIDSNPKFATFLSLLREKSFFDGATAGSAEYAKRMGQARAKFEQRAAPAADAAGSSSAPAPAAAVSADEVTPLAKQQAESAKNEGNALLGKGDFNGAVEKYSEAIRLNPTNAIYLANRAAAYVNLKQYEKAIADCKESIRIDPNYAKSYYRQGQSLAALGDYAGCLPPFEKALALSSKDESMAVTIREQIRIAKNKLNPPVANYDNAAGGGHAGGDDPFAALGGMGGLSSMLSGLGGGAGGAGGMDFGALLNNPAIAQMMQNPQMQDMMKNMDFGALMGGKDGLGSMMGGMAEGMANAPKETEVDTSYKPPSAASLFDDDEDMAPKAAAPAAAPKPSKPAASSAGAGAGGAGGAKMPPQLSAFLATPAGRAAAEDPELKPVLEDIKANGVGAAMKYMSNPSIMQKITALMGPMMGGGGR